MVAEALASERLEREPEWTEAIGVGSEEFVASLARRTKDRATLELYRTESGVWAVREAEPEPVYGRADPERSRGPGHG